MKFFLGPWTVLPFMIHTRAVRLPANSHDKRVLPTYDRGPEYGSVVITNWCDYDLWYQSFGAWRVDDPSDQQPDSIYIGAGQIVEEPYRETCYVPMEHISNPQTCDSLDKTEGQGVSMKITGGGNQIFQFEYALDENPNAREDFPRLNFDISLVDCARIDTATDVMAENDPELNAYKIANCPGYTEGLSLWFDDNDNCRPIYCDGVNYCDAVYNYDRTRAGEMSLGCKREYVGDAHLELCVSRGDGSAYENYMEWAATATNAADLVAPTGGSQIDGTNSEDDNTGSEDNDTDSENNPTGSESNDDDCDDGNGDCYDESDDGGDEKRDIRDNGDEATISSEFSGAMTGWGLEQARTMTALDDCGIQSEDCLTFTTITITIVVTETITVPPPTDPPPTLPGHHHRTSSIEPSETTQYDDGNYLMGGSDRTFIDNGETLLTLTLTSPFRWIMLGYLLIYLISRVIT